MKYRITRNEHYRWFGRYYGDRYFPQYRRFWFSSWTDLEPGTFNRVPRGVPTLKQAEQSIRDHKKSSGSREVVYK